MDGQQQRLSSDRPDCLPYFLDLKRDVWNLGDSAGGRNAVEDRDAPLQEFADMALRQPHPHLTFDTKNTGNSLR